LRALRSSAVAGNDRKPSVGPSLSVVKGATGLLKPANVEYPPPDTNQELLPNFEVLIAHNYLSQHEELFSQFILKLYVMPPAGYQPVIPLHRIRLTLELPNGQRREFKEHFSFICDDREVPHDGYPAARKPKADDPILVQKYQLVWNFPPTFFENAKSLYGSLTLAVGAKETIINVPFRALNL
jgi:hypothetical protein